MLSRFPSVLFSACLLLLFLTGVSQATSLSVLYDNTTQRLKRVYDVNPEKLQNNADAINHWLQGPASLQLIALPSQEQGGTDEFEVGVQVEVQDSVEQPIEPSLHLAELLVH